MWRVLTFQFIVSGLFGQYALALLGNMVFTLGLIFNASTNAAQLVMIFRDLLTC